MGTDMAEITITTQYAGSYSPSEEKFWEEIEFELEGVNRLLTLVHVETLEEGVEGTFRKAKGKDIGGMEVIRRRNITHSFDQLDYYIELGRTLLPYAWDLFHARQLTFEFVRIWTDLQACHGFLIAHYMDNSDDLTSQRGGAKVPKEIALQKKWLCHYLAPRIRAGMTKVDAMDEAVEEIRARIKSKPEGKFDAGWYRRLLSEANNSLTSTLGDKKLFNDEIFALAAEPADDIPPV